MAGSPDPKAGRIVDRHRTLFVPRGEGYQGHSPWLVGPDATRRTSGIDYHQIRSIADELRARAAMIWDVDVEVDPETGKVTMLRFVAAQDVGCAIHPSYVEGKIQGGVAQAIGWALNEEYIYDRNGRLDNAGFLDYRVPVASDMPMIEPILVEVPNPAHPYGAKGVGKVNIVPPMAAIANAIDSAIHRRLTELPMSPPKVRAALDMGQADD